MGFKVGSVVICLTFLLNGTLGAPGQNLEPTEEPTPIIVEFDHEHTHDINLHTFPQHNVGHHHQNEAPGFIADLFNNLKVNFYWVNVFGGEGVQEPSLKDINDLSSVLRVSDEYNHDPTFCDHHDPSPWDYLDPEPGYQFDPAFWDHLDPSSSDHHDPAAWDHHDPAAWDHHDPAAWDHHDPAAWDHHGPAAWDHYDPSSWDQHDPAAWGHHDSAAWDYPDPDKYNHGYPSNSFGYQVPNCPHLHLES